MDFDYGVDEAHEKQRTRYNFDKIKPGASLHARDDAERCRVMAAFKYWAHRDPRRRTAYATSAKVGDEDPKGPGYRIWFKSRREDAARMAEQVDTEVPEPNAAPARSEDI